ncbi:PASTA domain-containing protein [Nocardioides zhouii]|uniref:PASTA domain-containing protein n=1 Tax=Nocardioides zhouii TaxID=1168729 RepID=UPI0013EE3A36|nr:PASTA domain-containing protein [Nocardioides zhouii]
MKLVVVAVVLLLAGCSSTPSSGPSEPTSQPTSAQPTADDTAVDDHPGRPHQVGVLVGSSLRDVRRALRGEGLTIDVRRRARCAPGVVLEQSPVPGTKVERGATLHLVVSEAPAAATCIVPPGAAAVRALRDWALGDGPPPAFADRVRLLVANIPARTLSDDEAADRTSWNLPIGYAERRDVRILEALAEAPMRETGVPHYFCPQRGQALPADLLRRLPWSSTLVTRSPRACLEVVAVQVWAGAGGRITDVNILLGTP